MMDESTLLRAIDIITERILTPVLYMYEDEAVEFICFCDANIRIEDFRDTERAIYTELGINVEILDIREFDESDRWDIIVSSRLVYAANEIIKMAFEQAMLADIEKRTNIKNEILKRYDETGTYYIN